VSFFEIQSDPDPIRKCRIRLDRDPETSSCSTLSYLTKCWINTLCRCWSDRACKCTWRETAVCVGLAFLCLLSACFPRLTNNTLRKKRWSAFLPWNLNPKVDIADYNCVILKMVILHDAIKTLQNGVCVFSKKKKKKTYVFSKKQIKTDKKNNGGCFFQKSCFFSTLIMLWSFFCDFPSIARSGTSHLIINLVACTPHN